MPGRGKKAYYPITVRVDPTVGDYLRRHSFERSVSLARLVQDILTGWAIVVTDPKDPAFSGGRMSPVPISLGDEPWPGYFDTLGFELPLPGKE